MVLRLDGVCAAIIVADLWLSFDVQPLGDPAQQADLPLSALVGLFGLGSAVVAAAVFSIALSFLIDKSRFVKIGWEHDAYDLTGELTYGKRRKRRCPAFSGNCQRRS